MLAGRRSGKELRDHPELPPARPRTLPAVPAGQAAALAVVAALWGGSGPFLRAAAAGMEQQRGRGRLRQLLAELRFLSLNRKVRATTN